MKSATLTAKQERFCLEFVRSHDGPAAYRIAYEAKEMSDPACRVEASTMLANPKISLRILQIEQQLSVQTLVTPVAMLKYWWDIATADPRELIELRIGACRSCYGIGGAYHWTMPEYEEEMRQCEKYNRDLPNCSGGFGYDHTREPNAECLSCHGEGVKRALPKDTTHLSDQALKLYRGVKMSRHGLEILMADQDKALENVSRIIGAFKDSVRLEVLDDRLLERPAPTDPIEAARLYQDMMRRTSSPGATAH